MIFKSIDNLASQAKMYTKYLNIRTLLEQNQVNVSYLTYVSTFIYYLCIYLYIYLPIYFITKKTGHRDMIHFNTCFKIRVVLCYNNWGRWIKEFNAACQSERDDAAIMKPQHKELEYVLS